MSEPGKSARSLLEAGRRAYRAQPGDRERIASALRARLGPEALPLTAAVPSPPPRFARWQLAGASLGTGLAATLVTLWALGGRPVQPRAATVVPPPSAADEPVEAAPVPTAPEPPEPALPAPPTRAPAAHGGGRADALAQEVQLLGRATRAMRAGQPAKALSALDEHQRRFPRGALDEERRAARAQALCALGRVADGRAEQAQLPPRSPSAARAAQACDAAAAGERPH